MLILSTSILAVLSLIQVGRIDLASELQPQKAIPVGQPLFAANLRTTSDLKLKVTGLPEHHFAYDSATGLWNGLSPWSDRADGPKAVEALVKFAINASVVDSIVAKGAELAKYGFGSESIAVECRDSQDTLIAQFEIGKASAWKKKIEGKEETFLPTVYMRRIDAGNDGHIYLCSDLAGNIHQLFNSKLVNFRDHRPFALNVDTLKQISLWRSNTEIVLDRATPNSSWLITKPLELQTDRKAVMKFLANLSKLEAINIFSEDDISLPENLDGSTQVTITTFDSDQQITLTVYPAEEKAGSTFATVNNRNVVRELPLIATPKASNYITQLPDSINSLRSRTMLQLNQTDRADLRSIIVRTPNSLSDPVLIARLPSEPYQLIRANNQKEAINEAA